MFFFSSLQTSSYSQLRGKTMDFTETGKHITFRFREVFFSFLLNYDHATLGERLNWVRLFTLWVGGLFKQLLPSSLCGGSAGGSFRVSLMDAAKAGSLKTTGRGSHDRRRTGRGRGERKTRRESNPAHPPPWPSRRAERGLEVEEAFTAGAAALRVNTRRVNACLLMMLGAIGDGFTSNYTNKQRWCWYC